MTEAIGAIRQRPVCWRAHSMMNIAGYALRPPRGPKDEMRRSRLRESRSYRSSM